MQLEVLVYYVLTTIIHATVSGLRTSLQCCCQCSSFPRLAIQDRWRREVFPLFWFRVTHSLMGVANPVASTWTALVIVSQFVFELSRPRCEPDGKGFSSACRTRRRLGRTAIESECDMAASVFGNTRSGGRNTRLKFLVSLSLFTVGCSFPGQPDSANRPVPADQIVDFKVLYGQNCAGCHGAGGKLGPAPPLRDAIFQAIVPKEELETILTNGRHNTLMPAFSNENGGTLTSALRVLVHEIKGIPYRIASTHGFTV